MSSTSLFITVTVIFLFLFINSFFDDENRKKGTNEWKGFRVILFYLMILDLMFGFAGYTLSIEIMNEIPFFGQFSIITIPIILIVVVAILIAIFVSWRRIEKISNIENNKIEDKNSSIKNQDLKQENRDERKNNQNSARELIFFIFRLIVEALLLILLGYWLFEKIVLGPVFF